MDRLSNLVEEFVESVNPREQGLTTSDPSKSVRSESQTPAKPNEALLRIAQDMAKILDGLHESIKKYTCDYSATGDFLSIGTRCYESRNV